MTADAVDRGPGPPLLEVRDLHSDYAGSPVLFDIDLQVGAAEIVALIGRNGMGKTTLVRSIMGLTRPTSGQVTIEGHASVGLSAHHIARLGIALVPKWPPPRGRLPMAAVL